MFRSAIIIFSIVLFSCKKKETYTEIAQLNDPKQESIARGKKIYSGFCARCHLPDGSGIEGETPPLAGSDWLIDKRTETIHALKFGLKGKIEVNGKPYKGFMPKSNLEPQQTADVINYIMNSWGNTAEKLVTAEEVEAVVKK